MSDIDELGAHVHMPPKSTREVALVEPGRIAALEAENARLQRHLESMTPGGSEFHDNPARCVQWITQKHSSVIHQIQSRKQARAENARLRAACEAICAWCEKLGRDYMRGWGKLAPDSSNWRDGVGPLELEIYDQARKALDQKGAEDE